MSKTPTLTVFGGPNGSGKTTVTRHYPVSGVYINADIIKVQQNCTDREAAEIATALREKYLKMDEDFTFESVLSTPRNYEVMRKAKDMGKRVVCIYVLTNNPDINVARVKKRNRNGNDVPEEKVRIRYKRAMKLFPQLFEVCSELYVFDNSCDRSMGEPREIIRFCNGKLTMMPNEIWSVEMLEALCIGKYE